MPERGNDWLRRVYGAASPEELTATYDAWAADYDRDLEALGYRLPAVVAAMTARHVPAGDGPLLDAGCGTGQVGELLQALGYPAVDGLDMSEGMLNRAQARRVYDDLVQADLSQRLPVQDDTYAAAICSGVLTVAHAPPQALDELVRVTRPGGHLVFSLSEPARRGGGFADKIAELDRGHRWSARDASGPVVFIPGAAEETRLPGRVHVYAVT